MGSTFEAAIQTTPELDILRDNDPVSETEYLLGCGSLVERVHKLIVLTDADGQVAPQGIRVFLQIQGLPLLATIAYRTKDKEMPEIPHIVETMLAFTYL